MLLVKDEGERAREVQVQISAGRSRGVLILSGNIGRGRTEGGVDDYVIWVI